MYKQSERVENRRYREFKQRERKRERDRVREKVKSR